MHKTLTLARQFSVIGTGTAATEELKCCYHDSLKMQCYGSWFLPIPDPGSKNSSKREGWKKNCCPTFLLFCSPKFHIIENYFIFEMLKKKNWANFQRIIELFTQKIVTKFSKICVWDPGSRIQGSKKHRIPDPDRHHWKNVCQTFTPVAQTLSTSGHQCWMLILGQTRRLYEIPASVVKHYTPGTPFYG